MSRRAKKTTATKAEALKKDYWTEKFSDKAIVKPQVENQEPAAPVTQPAIQLSCGGYAKVGDMVEVVDVKNHYLNKGDVVKIESIDDPGVKYRRVVCFNGDIPQRLLPDQLKLPTKAVKVEGNQEPKIPEKPYDQLKNELRTVKGWNTKLKTEKKGLRDTAATLNKELHSVKDQLQESDSLLKAEQEIVKEYREKYQKLQTAKEGLSSDVKGLQSELAKMNITHDASLASSEQRERDLKNHNYTLEKQVAKLKKHRNLAFLFAVGFLIGGVITTFL